MRTWPLIRVESKELKIKIFKSNLLTYIMKKSLITYCIGIIIPLSLMIFVVISLGPTEYYTFSFFNNHNIDFLIHILLWILIPFACLYLSKYVDVFLVYILKKRFKKKESTIYIDEFAQENTEKFTLGKKLIPSLLAINLTFLLNT